MESEEKTKIIEDLKKAENKEESQLSLLKKSLVDDRFVELGKEIKDLRTRLEQEESHVRDLELSIQRERSNFSRVSETLNVQRRNAAGNAKIQLQTIKVSNYIARESLTRSVFTNLGYTMVLSVMFFSKLKLFIL